ncbi:hypothetical protein [Actinoplanes derwentensis]|uniref:hypothetical protein n=1 Tax=Actinoplanes derwentensis TaxID=113562 RepID=UPI0012FD98A1|nr:hypothetical protein [Actinoplanes derwentensis]
MSLLELAVGFLVAVVAIAVITMALRRRNDSRDLLDGQVREMQARVDAADPSLLDAANRIADTRVRETASGAAGPVEDTGVRYPDATAAPDELPAAPGGDSDAMADAYTWLRIVGLVESGQRAQAVELLSTTMAISADEAEMLVDGLLDAGRERRPD